MMSYLTQSEIANNEAMLSRIAQAAAGEGMYDNPDSWAFNMRRTWSSAPGWDDAWESAMVAAPGADPGINEAVITDTMILAQVQSMPPFNEPPANQ